jgi:CheY-like chemotaxis protein
VSRGEEILTKAQAISQMAIARLQTVLNPTDDQDAGAIPPAVPSQHGILLADDEPALRALLDRALRQEGFLVWAASDGVEALALFQQHRSEIGLVLLDVQMPGLDGPHTLAVLRQLAPDLHFCFITGDAGQYTDTDLRRTGVARIFQKPFDLDMMARYCGQVLDAASREES